MSGITTYHAKIEKEQIMFDIDRVMKVMSEILSDLYGAKITLTAIPKGKVKEQEAI